jgi:hypothetical protein
LKWVRGISGAAGSRARPTKIVSSVEEMNEDLEELEMYPQGRPPTRMALESDPPKSSGKVVKMKNLDLVPNTSDDEDYKQMAAGREQLRQDLLRETEIARTRADAYTTKFSVQVSQACTAFKRYSDDKINEFENQIKASEVFGPMAIFVLELVGGKLGEKIGKGLEEVGSKLANEVVGKIYGSLQSKFVNGVESKLEDNADVDALKRGVEAMVVSANDFATHVASEVDKTIVARLRAIENAVKAGKKLSEEDGGLIKPFLDGDTDSILESYGVPSPKTAKSIQIEIFRGLVQRFEEKRIVAKHMYDFGDSSGIEDRIVAGNAKLNAAEAAKARENAIDQEDAAATKAPRGG